MNDLNEIIAKLPKGLPGDKLPLAIARAAALLRSEGIDCDAKARMIVRHLLALRARTPVSRTDEERIGALYDRLHHADSETEQTELLRELRRLQQIEADRLIAEADARTSFRPVDALRAVDEARRLIAEHAAPLDDAATNHGD